MRTFRWLMDEYGEWHAYPTATDTVLPRTTALCGVHCLTGVLLNPIEPLCGSAAIPAEGERGGTIHGPCLEAFRRIGSKNAA